MQHRFQNKVPNFCGLLPNTETDGRINIHTTMGESWLQSLETRIKTTKGCVEFSGEALKGAEFSSRERMDLWDKSTQFQRINYASFNSVEQLGVKPDSRHWRLLKMWLENEH